MPEFSSIHSIRSIRSNHSTPTPTMIGLIGNHCPETTPEGWRLFGQSLGPLLNARAEQTPGVRERAA